MVFEEAQKNLNKDSRRKKLVKNNIDYLLTMAEERHQ